MSKHARGILAVVGVLFLSVLLAACGSAVATDDMAGLSATAVVTLTPSDTATPLAALAGTESLASLRKVDAHPLYTLRYSGAYAAYQRVESTLPSAEVSDWACSLFAALGEVGAPLYGRNFDWQHSPALLLFTAPPDAYASLSMVDLAYLDFSAAELDNLQDLTEAQLQPLLQAPYLPFDGMNEHGLTVGMAAVPESEMPRSGGPAIGSLGIIREMLDHARDVDEALALMRAYDIDMDGGPALHYLIADATGEAALVEFYQGEMHVKFNAQPWLQATNFLLAAAGDDIAERCWRYDKIAQRLSEAQGSLTSEEALSLLEDIAQSSTQWSILYNLNTLEVQVVMGQAYERVHTFPFDLEE